MRRRVSSPLRAPASGGAERGVWVVGVTEPTGGGGEKTDRSVLTMWDGPAEVNVTPGTSARACRRGRVVAAVSARLCRRAARRVYGRSMCGRFVSASSPALLAERFAVDEVTFDDDEPHYNVAPRAIVPVVR